MLFTRQLSYTHQDVDENIIIPYLSVNRDNRCCADTLLLMFFDCIRLFFTVSHVIH